MSCSYPSFAAKATKRGAPPPAASLSHQQLGARALWWVPCAASLKRAYRDRVRVSYIQSPATSRRSCFGVERGKKTSCCLAIELPGSYGASGL
jgi:hypothetical protein